MCRLIWVFAECAGLYVLSMAFYRVILFSHRKESLNSIFFRNSVTLSLENYFLCRYSYSGTSNCNLNCVQNRQTQISRHFSTGWPVSGAISPASIQIRLRIRTVWSESSLGAFWIVKDTRFLHADNEDWLDCAYVQADLSHRWVHTSEGMFSHVMARMLKSVDTDQIATMCCVIQRCPDRQ